MKTRVFVVLALIVFAPILVADQNKPASGQNRQNAQQSTQPAPVSTNCGCTANAEDSKDKSQGWHKFVAWPEGATTSALLVTMIIILWQAIETRRSVGATANSQRSWLLVESVDNPDLQQIWINKATINFKIIGNSPLRIMEGELIYAVVASRPDGQPRSMQREPDLPEKPIYRNPLSLADSPSMGKIHAPGDPIAVNIQLKSTILAAENVKALEDGNAFLCVYGFLRYQDSFVSWRRRETRFCFACGNWGPTSPKAADGYFVAGPTAYNDVVEVKNLAWKRLTNKAMRSHRKA